MVPLLEARHPFRRTSTPWRGVVITTGRSAPLIRWRAAGRRSGELSRTMARKPIRWPPSDRYQGRGPPGHAVEQDTPTGCSRRSTREPQWQRRAPLALGVPQPASVHGCLLRARPISLRVEVPGPPPGHRSRFNLPLPSPKRTRPPCAPELGEGCGRRRPERAARPRFPSGRAPGTGRPRPRPASRRACGTPRPRRQ